ncbi:ricin-type beta-trefoil lectin domain protein [Comamonas sp. Y33R10-2]|uniref:M66 family metalloprotease n=1 Tax=Comamonas sp. Y33R10-2 TaxID=2853257 RepID=UPI001C5CA8F4|nr:M66 family metalloprotease [Comamonas sp. Y33R10-2]QXZ08832.1 ricin-type beta-trefoil lectin domain protein [Comamonas sp. Y33R10-2]
MQRLNATGIAILGAAVLVLSGCEGEPLEKASTGSNSNGPSLVAAPTPPAPALEDPTTPPDPVEEKELALPGNSAGPDLPVTGSPSTGSPSTTPPSTGSPSTTLPSTGSPSTTLPSTGSPSITLPSTGSPGLGNVVLPPPTLGSGNGNSGSKPTYPELTDAKYSAPNALGFYDKDKTGQVRAVRNDLGGSLPGMVQFAQSHTMDPSGNSAKNMPTLTTEREALLLITPDPTLPDVEAMTVSVSVNGVSMGNLPMRHPNEIFRSDYNNNDGRPDYVYSRRAWSAVLPWNWVKPGMELRVSDSKSRSGTLAAKAIEFAAPGELVVHSIQLGMLTDPPKNDNDHWLLSQPAKGATDYFQTIPAAKLTVASYEPVKLPKVMVSNGTIYDTSSATEGNVYGGDMRGDTAKSTFSIGINMANWGVTSSDMQSQHQPQVTQSAVAHHAAGMYTNGRQSHGLSGGGAILTLYATKGNEFSHEIGHHYGLGHFPGQSGDNYFWAGHHHDSGWGFIGYRKRMRANLHWSRVKTGGMGGMPVFEDTYSFGTDAMAGGHYSSSLSNYTHYTGYSTKNKIQPSLDKPVPSATSPSGYLKWNATTQVMEPFTPTIPNQNLVWYNSPNGKFLAPRLHGVPVITLLGGYDPQTNKAILYPAARSNWGNVFTLPTTAANTTEPRQCWLDVSFANQPVQRIAVAGKRMGGTRPNKLHVNLAQSENPTQATLSCQTAAAAPEVLYTLDIPQNLPPMAPAVVVGKEAGYSAIRKVELPELQTALLSLASKSVLTLSPNQQLLLDSHSDHAADLSSAARTQLSRYTTQQSSVQRLNNWIGTYATQLEQNTEGAQAALLTLIQKVGMETKPLIPAAQSLKMSNGNCLQKTETGIRVAAKSLCTGAINEQWILDSRGSIRSRADLSQCLTDQGGSNDIKLSSCNIRSDAQVWDTSDNKSIKRGGRCMDLHSGYLTNNVGRLITYNCTNGANQQWSGLVQGSSMVMTLLDSSKVRYLEPLLKLQTSTGVQTQTH